MTVISTLLSSNIVNCQCATFRLVEGGTLILYLTGNTPELLESRMWIDCAWRLRKGASVQIGSLDDASPVLDALRQVEGRSLERVSVADCTGDLCLWFQGDLLIETFGYSVTGEHWEFRRSDGLRIGLGAGFEPYKRIVGPDG